MPRPTLRQASAWPPVTALVLGATGGLGGAIARQLLGAGTEVLASGRDPGRIEGLGRDGCRTWPGTLSGAAAHELVTAAVESLPSLELLVAAAGIGAAGDLADHSPELIRDVIDTDLTSVLLAVHAALPRLIQSSGRILVVGSVSGALAPRGEAVYAAAKAGLSAFASCLRSELAPSGVSVTLLVPAVVRTEFFLRRGRPAPRSAPRARTPEQVATAALEAARLRQSEVWVPGWLRQVARLRGCTPGGYHRLADAVGAGA